MTLFGCIGLEFLGVFQFILSRGTKDISGEMILNYDYTKKISDAKNLVSNDLSNTSTSTLRIKEKEKTGGEILFVDGRSNFTIPFSEEECDFENGAKIKDKWWNRKKLLDDEVNKRTPKCSNYLNSLFKILYRRGNKLFDK
jgi:hypothetical protein